MSIGILPEWTAKLTLQQQAVLLLALRGPDGFPKYHPSKPVLYFYRACLLRTAHNARMMTKGENLPSFMSMLAADDGLWTVYLKDYRDVEDELPLHYYTHLMHGAQVLAYKHPEQWIRNRWIEFYQQCCHYCHVPMESEAAMDERLSDFGRLENLCDVDGKPVTECKGIACHQHNRCCWQP